MAKDLPGTYVLNRTDVSDTVVIRADGAYRHTFVSFLGRRLVSDSGTWSADTSPTGRLRLTLKDFAIASVSDPAHTLPRPGLWVLELDQGWLAPLRLPVESDIGLYFEKK